MVSDGLQLRDCCVVVCLHVTHKAVYLSFTDLQYFIQYTFYERLQSKIIIIDDKVFFLSAVKNNQIGYDLKKLSSKPTHIVSDSSFYE